MENCIFCKIISGGVPAKFVYRDDDIVAFWDIKPSSPVHILITPKRHIAKLEDFEAVDAPILGKMLLVAKQIAQEQGVARSGYRLMINNGEDGGQIVPHLHLHLMGGRKF